MDIRSINQNLQVTTEPVDERETPAEPSTSALAEPATLTAEQENAAVTQAFNSFSGDIGNNHVGAEAKRAFRNLNRFARPAKSLARRYGNAISNTAIPAELHIVHFGGSLPPDVKENVEQWAQTNPHWEKNLWVDKDYLNQQQLHELKDHAGKHKYNLRYVNDEIYKNPPHSRLALARERASSKQLQATETSPELKEAAQAGGQKVADKNWGLVSDLARVEILMKKGGVYVDTDMKPGKRLPNKLRAKHGFLVNVKGTSDNVPANDIIATTRENKALHTYANNVADHYFNAVNRDDSENTLKKIGGPVFNEKGWSLPGTRDRLKKLGLSVEDMAIPEAILFNNQKQRDPTIRLTGPTALENALKKANPSLQRGNHETKGYRFPPKYVANHQVSENSWLKPDSSTKGKGKDDKSVDVD